MIAYVYIYIYQLLFKSALLAIILFPLVYLNACFIVHVLFYPFICINKYDSTSFYLLVEDLNLVNLLCESKCKKVCSIKYILRWDKKGVKRVVIDQFGIEMSYLELFYNFYCVFKSVLLSFLISSVVVVVVGTGTGSC